MQSAEEATFHGLVDQYSQWQMISDERLIPQIPLPFSLQLAVDHHIQDGDHMACGLRNGKNNMLSTLRRWPLTGMLFCQLDATGANRNLEPWAISLVSNVGQKHNFTAKLLVLMDSIFLPDEER